MKRRFLLSVKCDTTHCSSVLASLNKLKRKKTFCDVIIKSGAFEIKAHRNVLASASEYFENLFLNSETKEFRAPAIVDFSDFSPQIVELCINFIYSGEIEFFGKDPKLLLQASQKLRLHALSKFCLEILAEKMNLENCFEVISLVHSQEATSLDIWVRQFLLSNTKDFFKRLGFLNLELEEFIYCLRLLLDGSRVIEIEKWNGILAWVNFDIDTRKKDFMKLFRMVCMTGFSKEFLRKILKEPLVESSNACLQAIASFLTNECSDCSTIKGPSNEKKLTHILACKVGSQIIVKYDVKRKKWSRFMTFPGQFTVHCDVIAHGSNIYIGTGDQIYTFIDGKWDTKVFQTTVKCTQCSSIYWHVGQMQNVIEFGGSIWLLSSLSPQRVEIVPQTIECVKCLYSFRYEGSLDMRNSLHCPPRESCYNRCVLVRQVFYMITTEYLIEYSHSSKKISCQGLWSNLGHGFFIAASESKIYAMGGLISEKHIIEYDIATKEFYRLPDMITKKLTGQAFWYSRNLYVLGGDYPANLEQYNPCTNQWNALVDFTFPLEIIKVFVGDALYLVNRNMTVKRISLEKLKSLSREEHPEADAETLFCLVDFYQKLLTDGANPV